MRSKRPAMVRKDKLSPEDRKLRQCIWLKNSIQLAIPESEDIALM